MHRFYKAFSLGTGLFLFTAMLAGAQPQENPLGTTLPMQDQSVQRVDGTQTTLGALAGTQGTVFLFWSNNCTWIDNYEARVRDLHKTFGGQGIAFVLVNANDPAAFPEEAAAAGAGKNYPMPYIIDAGSQFAQAVGAFRTPHVFAYDASKTLVYTGTIDDSPGDPGNVQKTYLQDVLTALAQGNNPSATPTKAFGCRIKFYGGG